MSGSPLLADQVAPAGAARITRTGITDLGEEVLSNARPGDARITICVPTWKDNADALLCALPRLAGADQCTLLIFDDGSRDSDLTRQLARHIMRYPGPARLICAPKNLGRSHARNRLQSLAETDWILFVDADMQPDDEDFLNRYLDAIDATDEAALIAGGFSLKHAHPTAETRLHAAQSAASECVPASIRAEAAGRYVFTSNILVHRNVLSEIKFDPGFIGWGWEDVDWGLRVAAAFPIHHIDNTASHLGLDPDAKLVEKYSRSGYNFARLVSRHPDIMEATRLYRNAAIIRRLPLRDRLERLALNLSQTRALPINLRLLALKTYRAAVYAAQI